MKYYEHRIRQHEHQNTRNKQLEDIPMDVHSKKRGKEKEGKMLVLVIQVFYYFFNFKVDSSSFSRTRAGNDIRLFQCILDFIRQKSVEYHSDLGLQITKH